MRIGPEATRNLQFSVSFDAERSVCDQIRVSNLQRYDSVLWKDADPDIPIMKQGQGEVREAAVAGEILLRRLLFTDSCCYQAWLLKNSFPRDPQKLDRVRMP